MKCKYLCCGCRKIHDDDDYSPLEGDIELFHEKQVEVIEKLLKELRWKVGE